MTSVIYHELKNPTCCDDVVIVGIDKYQDVLLKYILQNGELVFLICQLWWLELLQTEFVILKTGSRIRQEANIMIETLTKQIYLKLK